MKKIVVLCLISLLAVFVAGCADAGPASDKDPGVTEPEIRTYIAPKPVGEKLAFVYNDTLIVTEYAYDRDLSVSYSLDGTSAACMTGEGALLYIHDGTVEKIADQPKSYCMSVSGDAIAFLSGPDLYLYQKQTGKIQQVTSDVDSPVRSYTLSPDGKTLAYVTFAFGTNSRLFLYQNGTSTLRIQFKMYGEESETYDLISINDSADLIYMHNGAEVVSMAADGTITEVGRTTVQSIDQDLCHVFYSNADHSQLLFVSQYGTHISTQGQIGITICAGFIYPVQRALAPFHDGQSVITCDFEDLSQQVMRDQSDRWYDRQEFWYPNENGEYVMVADYSVGYRDYWLDPSGSYLYYMDNQQALYVLDLKNGGQSTMLAEMIYSYAVSYDVSAVYYFYGCLTRCSATEASEPVKAPIEIFVGDFYFSENNQLFVAVEAERGTYDLYTISQDDKASVLLRNIRLYPQDDCGMIYLTTEDGYYVIRSGKLIQLQVKTME